MKKRFLRKFISFMLVCMFCCALPMNAEAADVITVDFSQFVNGFSWCDGAGNYRDGAIESGNCVCSWNSGGVNVYSGYSVALVNVSSISFEYAKPLWNSGTIISTDGCIDYVRNYSSGTISGGTFGSVTMEGGTIDGATITGALEYQSNCIIQDVILAEGAKILEYRNGNYVEVVGEPGVYTLNNGEWVASSGEEPAPAEPKESAAHIFYRELLTRASAAKPGDTLKVDATVWHSFSANVLKELFSKEGVNYTFYYNFRGECFYVDVPQGAKLEEGIDWYGPLKLNAMFGRTMIEKSELDEIISE
ncbi:MAG: hypothetical protein IKL78_07060 [Lachnospiraceae bacterium]|nr:hypothetical protein [Lachnospiraceae bacterium]